MLRLTLVFLVWMGSTAYALENADTDHETRLHEADIVVWNEADDEEGDVLAHWCGVLTDADVHTILPPHEIADGFLGRP